jgi:DNA-binding response OmpR family regulator
MRVVLLDPTRMVLPRIAAYLDESGISVVQVLTGAATLSAIRIRSSDVIFMHLAMEDVPTIDLIWAVRAVCRSSVVVVLTDAVGKEREELRTMGVDDCISPSLPDSSIAERIKRHVLPAALRNVPDLVVGRVRIAPGSHRVFVDDIELSFTPKEFKLLLALASVSGDLLDRRALLRIVWGQEADLATRTVDQHVRQIRRKLKSKGVENYVRIVPKEGYSFSAAV